MALPLPASVPSAPPAAVPAAPIERGHALFLLEEMIRVRRFEEKSAEMYSAGKIRGFLHLYVGEEAVAAGVMPALGPEDAVVATYREHGHALLRGLSARSIMAEMYGKVEGCSRGRGGSMHLFDAATRFYGGNAIVGGGLPLAVGLALSDRILGRERVTACFFGDGAVAEGEFHECMNLAALWKLPVLFLCENNLYAMGTRIDRAQARTDLAARASTYGMPADSVDGMDVVAVEAAARRAVESMRRERTPRFLELRTYRFRAHSMFDPELYRDKAEVEEWKARDPIATFVRRLKEFGAIADADVEAIERKAAAEIDDAVAFAEGGHPEAVEDLAKDVYCEAPAGGAPKPVPAPAERHMTYREAVRWALRRALETDPKVFLMGEDVGKYGGCYAVSGGLLKDFGEQRVRDTPMSESAFVGAGIGAALGGARPVVEVMTVNFSLLALDQILNNAATLRHMSGGLFAIPLVIRMATGAGRQVAAQHSHSLEGWYAHIPGIKILAPATVSDAAAMLLGALDDPNPILIFEHATLYNAEGDLDATLDTAHIWKAAIRRPGSQVTLIAYGGMVGRTLEAADRLAREDGIDAEVVDLRSLRPLDTETILASVAKTRRVVIVDEGWRSGSLSAEIVARIVEGGFYDLDAPIERVCSAEVPVPYARHLEEAALPQAAGIIAAAKKTLGTHG